jgi:prepilin peptidase CpaA
MSLSLPPRGAEAVLLTLVMGAAIYDARFRRIPNWLTASGVLFGLALNTFTGRPGLGVEPGLPGFVFALKGLALGFGLYFALHALRAMGAGDVKLMAAVGSLIGWEDWFGIFVCTAITGGILSILVSLAKRRLGKTLFNVGFILSEMRRLRPAYLKNEELDVKSDKALRLPHGVVIAAGTLIFLAASAHFASQ